MDEPERQVYWRLLLWLAVATLVIGGALWWIGKTYGPIRVYYNTPYLYND